MFQARQIFRTRRPDRDLHTDAARLAAVTSVVEQQLAAANQEMAGLKTRMEKAYQSAAALLDASEAYGERSTEEEAEITAFEASAKAARIRLASIERQMDLFARIKVLLAEADGKPTTE